MGLPSLAPWARELLDTARVGHLGLLDDEGSPRVLPVCFALEDGALWSAIDAKPKRSREPARIRWLRADPRATLTVDVYSDDWSRLAWVQVLGSVEVQDVAAAPAALSALRDKYEPYRDASPPGPLLRLEPHRAVCWRAADG